MKRGSAQDLPGGPVVGNLSQLMQGTQVLSLVWGGSGSLYKNYGSLCALESVFFDEKQTPDLCNPEKSPCSYKDPAQPKTVND